MCRIFGFITSDSRTDLDRRIRLVSLAQTHGGPDDQQIHIQNGCGIGVNRLAIIDPEGGSQPYASIPGLYVVLNGEIYNHNALRRELEADGHRFHDRCDGSILPALYQKYGASFAEYLDGMFSIAILDMRGGKPVLTMASDTTGIKPVYYTYRARDNAFGFATEIQGLLKFEIASRTIWYEGVDHVLTTRAITGGRTMLKDVRTLQPGTILQIIAGQEPVIRRYNSRIMYDGPVPQSPTEAGEIFFALIAQEVRNLSRADAKVCSVNSGGLDSSLLTALMSRRAGHGFDSFHVACDGNWPFDERTYARELADLYNLAHHEIILFPDEIPDLIPQMVSHLGQPNCAPHAMSAYKLYKGVSSKGFRVAIAGEGSDELFCGHDRMGLAIRDNSPNWMEHYLDRISPCPEQQCQSLYNQDYVEGLEQTARERVISMMRAFPGDKSAIVRNFEQKFSLPYYILHRIEPLAMASGVEVRVPFCQPRIVDFSWKMDSRLFFDDARGKAPVYAAAKGLLPNSILNRPKQPFTLPIISMMQKGSKLMTYAKDVLLSRAMLENGPFDAIALTQLIERQENNPDKASAYTIWALMVYGVWADQMAAAPLTHEKHQRLKIVS